jgi:hypothetical protein
MRYYNQIRIHFNPSSEVFDSISKILVLEPKIEEIRSHAEHSTWTYEIVTENEDPYYDFINNFLDLFENKYEALKKIGITRDCISFWLLYEYDQQCNLEFDPQRMKRLGEAGIVLCISCWDNGEI